VQPHLRLFAYRSIHEKRDGRLAIILDQQIQGLRLNSRVGIGQGLLQRRFIHLRASGVQRRLTFRFISSRRRLW
jgi:hypothetical protein